jgi:formate dehydrogenase maturation protein FdhE
MSGSSTSILEREEPLACPRCGTEWRLNRGLCVNCLLSPGLETDMHHGQALDDVLDQIDMSDGD